MTNLLWSALNLALVLGLLYTSFQATQLVRQHIGSGTALFFVFGLLLIGCGKSTKQQIASSNLLSHIPKDAPLGNASSHQAINLGGSNKLELRAEYYQENGKVRPRGLYATVSGFMVGHTWQPNGGFLEQSGRHLRYHTFLTHNWNLLGVQVFTQTEEFSGAMSM
ncbi:hypothetical protein [Hymenobacter cavernae]|uniref:Uncharacterized protein n=1 Tax=Hymenobacter cavernae TaxID=2044852 RepID=A0ABQ1TKK3_9BACT|nr:hypothetical protein [Hymenobacter cavernae]GGE97852.1 hypothetical protein GCM10011383_05790 [Hymenobacter cavernae]